MECESNVISRRAMLKAALVACAAAAASGSVSCARGSKTDSSASQGHELRSASGELMSSAGGPSGDTSKFGDIAAIVPAVDGLCAQLAPRMSEIATSENLCYSPISIYMGLALVALGAGGTSQEEVLNVLGVESASELSERCAAATEALQIRGLKTNMPLDVKEDSRLELANSIWSALDWKFTDEYLGIAESVFGATAESVQFGTQEANDRVTSWVDEKTNGLLNPRFDFTATDVAVLVNTVYFKDTWYGECFGERSTSDEPFKFDEGESDVPSIRDRFKAHYGVFDGYTAAKAVFSSGASITFFLPDESVSLEGFITDWTRVAELLASELSEEGLVAWTLPKFDLKCGQVNLVPALQALGITHAFDRYVLGDFDSMIQPASSSTASLGEDPYLSGVLHDARVALDEFGVEAAAYTVAEMKKVTASSDNRERPKVFEFKVDRPFAYAIKAADETTLFFGTVKDPRG